MSRARTKSKPRGQTTKVRGAVASHTPNASLMAQPEWPEVLSLAEAAAYLRVPEAEVERIAGTQSLPGRRIRAEWRFSRMAIQDRLRRQSTRESLLRLAGTWKDD